MRSKVVLRAVVVAFSAAVSLSAGEAALRACSCARLGLGIPGTTGVLPFPDNPTGVFRFHYNTLGDRTHDVAVRRDSDDPWCVVGDSHTNGLGVDDGDRLSERLERALRNGGRSVVVFNTASPGATLPQYESMARRCEATYGARTVVAVVYLGNDLVELAHWIDYGQPRDQKEDAALGLSDQVKKRLRRSFLYDAAAFAWHHLDRRQRRQSNPEDSLQAFYQAEFYMERPSREAADLAVFDRELQAMSRVADEGRARLLVVVLPSWLQSDGTADQSERARFEVALERRIAARIANSGLDYVDLAPALASAGGGPKFWPVDRHLNTHGHEIAADAILRHGR
jgi:GDSL-like Lipase/Acylhydrolase family